MAFRDFFFDVTSHALQIVWRIVPYNFKIRAKSSLYSCRALFFFKPGITIGSYNILSPVGNRGTKLTVRASAITTTRKFVRYRRSLPPWRKVFNVRSRGYHYFHHTTSTTLRRFPRRFFDVRCDERREHACLSTTVASGNCTK